MPIPSASLSSAIALAITFIVSFCIFLYLYKKFKSLITNNYVWLSILVVIFIVEFIIAKFLLFLF